MATNETICSATGTRTAACACSTCGRGEAASAKRAANLRDAAALARLIAGHIDVLVDLDEAADPNWSDVGTAADLREKLACIVVAIAGGESEDEARRRIEDALNAEDAEVEAALINTIC